MDRAAASISGTPPPPVISMEFPASAPLAFRPRVNQYAHSFVGRTGLLILAVLGWSAYSVQGKPDKVELREIKREMQAEPAASKSRKGDKSDAKSSRPAPGEPDTRALTRVRENLEVPDDAEWDVIASRINEVVSARAALGLPVPGFKVAPTSNEKGKRGTVDANSLRSALRDQLPDGEIKVRLDRAHEDFERKQARVNQAHANLRAVLTVRQEAVAVVAGLLPP